MFTKPATVQDAPEVKSARREIGEVPAIKLSLFLSKSKNRARIANGAD
jgi:hypothetical protein